jgi:hypothetical protein
MIKNFDRSIAIQSVEYRQSLDVMRDAIVEFQNVFRPSALRMRVALALTEGTLAWHKLPPPEGWVFVWETGSPVNPQRTPLSHAPTLIRLEAVERIGEFVEVMTEEMTTVTTRVTMATATLRALTERIRT